MLDFAILANIECMLWKIYSSRWKEGVTFNVLTFQPTFMRHSIHWGELRVETVQDFLIKLDIKPQVRLLEISIFSLNNDLVRLTKLMNNPVKDLKILRFKVIFKRLKLVNLSKKNFCEEYLIRRPTSINEIFWKLWYFKYSIY